jgi:hypothetical protein
MVGLKLAIKAIPLSDIFRRIKERAGLLFHTSFADFHTLFGNVLARWLSIPAIRVAIRAGYGERGRPRIVSNPCSRL